MTEILQRGRYVDELAVGDVFHHRPGRTATEADNVLFSALTMNTQALHLDAAYAATQEFGERLMNSMWTLATMVGASVAQVTQGTLVAQLGLSDIAFPAPLLHGDTLYVDTEILETRLSRSRVGQGVVTMRHTGRNQDGTVVATATRVALMSAPPPRSSRERLRAGPGAAVLPRRPAGAVREGGGRADAVILDLEDAVSADAKASARGAVMESDLDPEHTIVRVNALDGEHIESDLATLSLTDYRTVMVAKAESAKQIGRLDRRFAVIALCETARGVVAAEKIAALDNVVALMWGAEDLVASLGGTASRKPKGRYRDVARHARARVLLAAGARGKAAIDAVHLDIADQKGCAGGRGCGGERLRGDRLHPSRPGVRDPCRLPPRPRCARVGAGRPRRRGRAARRLRARWPHGRRARAAARAARSSAAPTPDPRPRCSAGRAICRTRVRVRDRHHIRLPCRHALLSSGSSNAAPGPVSASSCGCAAAGVRPPGMMRRRRISTGSGGRARRGRCASSRAPGGPRDVLVLCPIRLARCREGHTSPAPLRELLAPAGNAPPVACRMSSRISAPCETITTTARPGPSAAARRA